MSEEAKRGTPNPWLCEEPEETRGLGFDEIRQQQQKIIQGTYCSRTVAHKPGYSAVLDYSLSLLKARVQK
jgi:hypothetical protein